MSFSLPCCPLARLAERFFNHCASVFCLRINIQGMYKIEQEENMQTFHYFYKGLKNRRKKTSH